MAFSVDTKKLHETEVKVFKGFRDFILRGNVMDLAVAVIIGAAFTNIVTALTKNIISPLIAAMVGEPNFDYLYLERSRRQGAVRNVPDRGYRLSDPCGGRLLPACVCRRNIC